MVQAVLPQKERLLAHDHEQQQKADTDIKVAAAIVGQATALIASLTAQDKKVDQKTKTQIEAKTSVVVKDSAMGAMVGIATGVIYPNPVQHSHGSPLQDWQSQQSSQ